MARPRVFVSSTYYDLKHVRASLDNFIASLGFEAILSEKGRVAYSPEMPLDESCYREVGTADIFLLIIGGRYGSEASGSRSDVHREFYDRYNSVTREEYRAAVERGIPVYVLVEKSVYVEYETYLKNRKNVSVEYAHVESVNVFELIESILMQPRNNPVQQFERYAEIEQWLREQWAGLFRELLQRMQTQAQLASLQAQVTQLAEVNKTLKTYLEEVVTHVAPDSSEKIIRSETERLERVDADARMEQHPLLVHFRGLFGIPAAVTRAAAEAAISVEDFLSRLCVSSDDPKIREEADRISRDYMEAVHRDLNVLRQQLGLAAVPVKENTRAAAGRVVKRRSHGARR